MRDKRDHSAPKSSGSSNKVLYCLWFFWSTINISSDYENNTTTKQRIAPSFFLFLLDKELVWKIDVVKLFCQRWHAGCALQARPFEFRWSLNQLHNNLQPLPCLLFGCPYTQTINLLKPSSDLCLIAIKGLATRCPPWTKGQSHGSIIPSYTISISMTVGYVIQTHNNFKHLFIISTHKT